MAVAVFRDVSEVGVKEALCTTLWQFRVGLEGQAEQSVAAMRVPIGLLLSDLCVFAGLSEEQHARVLGDEGVEYVNEVLATRWKLKTSDHGRAARQ